MHGILARATVSCLALAYSAWASLRSYPGAARNSSESVAICSAIKDSHDDIVEWVEYHLFVGVKFILVFDDSSDPPLTTPLNRFIRSGSVAVIPLQPHSGKGWGGSPQDVAFNSCVHRLRQLQHDPRWIAYIDVDEFIVLLEPGATPWDLPSAVHQPPPIDLDPAANLPTYLSTLQGTCAGILLNWVTFGTSGLTVRAPQGVLASHTACLPPEALKSHAVKSIVDSRWVDAWPQQHLPSYLPGAPPVCTANGSTIPDLKRYMKDRYHR
jgi:hypothetical protein